MSDIIYIAQAENGLYKIGQAQDLIKRLSALNSQSPIEIQLIYAAKVKQDNLNEIEHRAHQEVAEYRVRGEWFCFPAEKLEDIKSLIGGNEITLKELDKHEYIQVGQYSIYWVESRSQHRMVCPRCLGRGKVQIQDEIYRFKCHYCTYEFGFSSQTHTC